LINAGFQYLFYHSSTFVWLCRNLSKKSFFNGCGV